MVFNLDMDKKAHRGIDIPMFEETMGKFRNLEFLRDDKGRWEHVAAKAGWYQDIDGNLYNYDGVIWDVVPEVRLENLEYLG